MRIVLLPMLFCLHAPLLAAERACPGTAVTVRAESLSDAGRICLGASNLLPFLRQFGLDAAIPIAVEVTDAQLPVHLAGELGSFDTRDNVVRIRTYAAFSALARSGAVFRIPPDEALHVSYVTHELVHAYTHAGMHRRRIGWVAQEYIAYAAQIASMPEPLRERILSRYEQKGFADASEIGETYLLLDPHAFAVKAYRHYSLPGNGPAFVRRLLDGSLRLGENSR